MSEPSKVFIPWLELRDLTQPMPNLIGRDNYGQHFTVTMDRGQVADLSQQLQEWLTR